MTVSCHIMLGGLFGIDGLLPLVNKGMRDLAARLRMIEHVRVDIRTWDHWGELVPIIYDEHQRGLRVAVIGYSGGGSRASILADYMARFQFPENVIDLLVAYDPSPQADIKALRSNVKRAICYQSVRPMMFGLGGGVLVIESDGPKVEVHRVTDQHMQIQFNERLHQITIEAVKQLAA